MSVNLETVCTRDTWLILLKHKLDTNTVGETAEVVDYRNALNNINTSLEPSNVAWPMTPFPHP